MPAGFLDIFGGQNPLANLQGITRPNAVPPINANMNPLQNTWNGDQFQIGKPQVNGGPGGGAPPMPHTMPTGAPPTPEGNMGGAAVNPFLMQQGLAMMGNQPQGMTLSDLRPMNNGGPVRPQTFRPMQQSRMQNPLRKGMY